MKHFGLAGLGLLMAHTASAATVAVIDSGLDVNHNKLLNHVWVNEAETRDNQQDEDQNGFVDDLHGWNFAENNNLLLDPRFAKGFSEDCYEFFRKQGRMAAGIGTAEDKTWLANKQKNPLFVAELMRFGNYVHGTHVAGVAAGSEQSTESVLGIKIIPTAKAKITLGQALEEALRDMPKVHEDQEGIVDGIIRFTIRKVVDVQSKTVGQAIGYAADQEAQVANGSFGVSLAAVRPILKGFLSLFRKGSDEDLKTYGSYLIERMNQKTFESIAAAPNTVFVFAAGNDGTSNDDEPVSPAGVRSDSVITVAATKGLSALASFSNYGMSVDVAAPGVNIRSTVPGNRFLEMSGTSMAAPYVTRVVALVRDANPELSPAEVKQIVMGTVDQKDFLKGKVASSGIVNADRAVYAAKLAESESLEKAIGRAVKTVADQTAPYEGESEMESGLQFVTPMPSPIAL